MIKFSYKNFVSAKASFSKKRSVRSWDFERKFYTQVNKKIKRTDSTKSRHDDDQSFHSQCVENINKILSYKNFVSAKASFSKKRSVRSYDIEEEILHTDEKLARSIISKKKHQRRKREKKKREHWRVKEHSHRRAPIHSRWSCEANR